VVLTAASSVPPRTSPSVAFTTRVRTAVKEVYGARELTSNLVRRDLKVRHRGTFLGMLWSLTTPLLIVSLYYVVFRYILRVAPAQDLARPDGNAVPFAVYFFCGLTVWNLFSTSLLAGAGSVTGSGYLLRKVYFPRAILPLSAVLAALVTFAFEFAVLLTVTLLTVGLPSVHILWAPVIVLEVVLMAYGFALLLSAVTVFLRDVAHFIGVFMQIWFWGTPVIYSLGFVGDHPGLVRLLKLNPMTGPVVAFRNVVVLNHSPSLRLLAYSGVFAVGMLAVGAWFFQRWQRLFSEIV
jgi:ABC-type polysaccharide/polyol phosphate export permease